MAFTPNCFNCDRYQGQKDRKSVCEAFPDGIPLSVLSGEASHLSLLFDEHGNSADNGVFYKRKKEK